MNQIYLYLAILAAVGTLAFGSVFLTRREERREARLTVAG
jgi:hypothetical protein